MRVVEHEIHLRLIQSRLWWTVGEIVTANRNLALTAQQVTVTIIAAPSTFRRGLAAQISRFNATHAEGANLVYFAEWHLAGRSRAAEGGG